MAAGLSPTRMMKEIISSLMYLLTSKSVFLHSSIQRTAHNIKMVKVSLLFSHTSRAPVWLARKARHGLSYMSEQWAGEREELH